MESFYWRHKISSSNKHHDFIMTYELFGSSLLHISQFSTGFGLSNLSEVKAIGSFASNTKVFQSNHVIILVQCSKLRLSSISF